ncbi:Uncharacterised protein [Aeromonas hydrophila]|nr:Uncharacterised protein [Aeromonas hydrophila]
MGRQPTIGHLIGPQHQAGDVPGQAPAEQQRHQGTQHDHGQGGQQQGAIDGLTGTGHLLAHALYLGTGLCHLAGQLGRQLAECGLNLGRHQVIGLIPVRGLTLLDHLAHQLGKGGRHLLEQRPDPFLRLGKVGLLLFQLGHPLLVELVIVLVFGAIVRIPRDEEVTQGGERIGKAVVGIPHLLEQQATIAGQLILRGRHLFVGKGLQLIEGRLCQRPRLLQHQGMGGQILVGLGYVPHLLLAGLEGLERAGKLGGELLMLDHLPGPLPLLLEAVGLRRILAQDEIGPQGGDGRYQRLLAGLIPLQGGQGLLHQSAAGLSDAAELVVDQAGREDHQQIDKTEAEQQLA